MDAASMTKRERDSLRFGLEVEANKNLGAKLVRAGTG